MDCKNCKLKSLCNYANTTKDQIDEMTARQEIPEIWDYDSEDGLTCNSFLSNINK